MTDKILTQFALFVISFFAIWFALSQINFVDEDEVHGFAKENERRLGEMILETLTTANETIKDEKINAVIDSIKVRICRTKAIDCGKIKIHVIRNSEINAFALPDNHMVVYTGLIEYADNAEEVAGVMAHEIAHMEKNHVMKKLVKEVGLEMLFAITGGDAGFEILRQTGKTLSSSAFDREQEREADEYAVETLARANVDPQHLSNLFFRLSQKHSIPEGFAWISTHPDSKDRAADIIKKKKEYTYEAEAILNTRWSDVKDLLRHDPEEISDRDPAIK